MEQEAGGEKCVTLEWPGFLVLEPGGASIECTVAEVSDGGAGLRVSSLPLPQTFELLLTANGKVRRQCHLIWRRGKAARVRFLRNSPFALPEI